MKTAQDGGKVVSLRHRSPLSPGNKPGTNFWSDPEGSRKLKFPDAMTTAQDGGKVVSLRHRSPLPPGNKPGTNFWSDPEGSRKLRFPDFMTTAQDGGKVTILLIRLKILGKYECNKSVETLIQISGYYSHRYQ